MGEGEPLLSSLEVSSLGNKHLRTRILLWPRARTRTSLLERGPLDRQSESSKSALKLSSIKDLQKTSHPQRERSIAPLTLPLSETAAMCMGDTSWPFHKAYLDSSTTQL